MSEADTTSILITREDSCVDQSLDTVAEMKMLEEDRLNADMQRKRDRDIRDLQVGLLFVWCVCVVCVCCVCAFFSFLLFQYCC